MLIYSIISFVSGFFFSDVSAVTLVSVFLLWSFGFVVFLCKRDCFDGKMKYDRFLQVLVEHVTITSPALSDHFTIIFAQNTRRLPISRNSCPINCYRIRVEKIQAYAFAEKQKGNSKLREITSHRPLLLLAGFSV